MSVFSVRFSVMEFFLVTSLSVSYILQRKEVAKCSFAADDEDAYGPEEVHSTGLSWPSRRFLHPEKWILTLFVGCALVKGACHITDSSLNSDSFCMLDLWEATQHQVLRRNTKTFHIGHSFMQYWGFLIYRFFIALDCIKLIN